VLGNLKRGFIKKTIIAVSVAAFLSGWNMVHGE